MKKFPSETLGTRRGPESWFTGVVWMDEVVGGGPPARLKATRVSFAPGARTAWHTHPLGQALHVLSGMGWVQVEGEAPQAIRSGDSVWIEPGERHWHGATADRTLIHLAIQNADPQSVDVVWLEHVTDAVYSMAAE